MPDQSLYVCYEPHRSAYASKLQNWTHTNDNKAWYDRRFDADDSAAVEIKQALIQHIQEADVVVCIISMGTADDDWINWELTQARAIGKPMVGILLNELDTQPAAMHDCGAVFCAFEKGQVQRAIDFVFGDKPASDDYTIQDF